MTDRAGREKLLRQIGDIGAVGSTRDEAKWSRICPAPVPRAAAIQVNGPADRPTDPE